MVMIWSGSSEVIWVIRTELFVLWKKGNNHNLQFAAKKFWWGKLICGLHSRVKSYENQLFQAKISLYVERNSFTQTHLTISGNVLDEMSTGKRFKICNIFHFEIFWICYSGCPGLCWPGFCWAQTRPWNCHYNFF